MSQWDDFIGQIVTGLKAEASGPLAGYAAAIEADGRGFVTQAQADLKTWTQQVAQGQITADDLAFNVRADVATAELQALTDAGIGLEALQTFRDAMVNVVVNAAFKVFVP